MSSTTWRPLLCRLRLHRWRTATAFTPTYEVLPKGTYVCVRCGARRQGREV